MDFFHIFGRNRGCPQRVRLAVLTVIGSGVMSAAQGQTSLGVPNNASAAQAALPASSASSTASAEAAAPVEPTGLWARSTLLGDLGGLRPLLDHYGVTLNVQETSELYGNFSGGTRRGVSYDGATQFGLSVDTDKAFGLNGGQFFIDALQIHGNGITASHLDALQSVSGVEAPASTRLWEMWYQQAFGDQFDIKMGQQSLDQEFIVSQYANTFVNATFGWPVLPAVDLPSGGPAYPLASLGVRLRVKPSESVTILGGVFDGNPAPDNSDTSGTAFNLHNGTLLIGEIQYAINQPPSSGSSVQSSGLPGTYKLGFWYNSNSFADPYYGTDGLSLANPLSNQQPTMHQGNFSLYAVADQMVWRAGSDSPRSVGVFARAMGAPSNRNLIDFNLDAGVVLKAPFKGRDNDSVGLAVGYANISSSASAFDRATALTSPGYPVRTAETVVEATYQYQVAPWWLLQADFQYIFRPGGGVPNPQAGNNGRIGNEAVAGLRTVVTF